MRFSVLGSGSKGNCTLVESGDTTILIDGGFSGKEILRRLALIGKSPESITAILVTHEHNDHIQGVGVLSRRLQIPVYANPATHEAAAKKLGQLFATKVFSTGTKFAVQDLEIHPFSVLHDTADPVGFTVSDGKRFLGYCTDTGKITAMVQNHLRRCQALILEANHDLKMLREGPYPLKLQQRVQSNQGHLENEAAAGLAAHLREEALQLLVFAHLSETNNHPECVLQAAVKMLGHEMKGVEVKLAHQQTPGPLLEIAAPW